MAERRTGLMLLLLLLLLCGGQVHGAVKVPCLLHSFCVLPCSFDPGPEVVIHWLKPPDSSDSVHSFYRNKDQLERQQLRYKGRTELFSENISKGNASLRITGINLADSGAYKCYISTTTGSSEVIIRVEVQAPVNDVILEEDGQRLTCASGDIYPKPSVSWSPPSDPNTSVTPSEAGLFSVLSSVLLQDPAQNYSCNISNEHSWRNATYRWTAKETSSGSRTELQCAKINSSIRTLVWTFNRTDTIVNQTSSNLTYGPKWKERLEPVQGLQLVFKSLTQDQQGLFSCFLSTDLGSTLTVTKVTVTEAQKPAVSSVTTVAVVVPLVVVVVVGVIALGYFLYRKCRRNADKVTTKTIPANNGNESSEMRNLQSHSEEI